MVIINNQHSFKYVQILQCIITIYIYKRKNEVSIFFFLHDFWTLLSLGIQILLFSSKQKYIFFYFKIFCHFYFIIFKFEPIIYLISLIKEKHCRRKYTSK